MTAPNITQPGGMLYGIAIGARPENVEVPHIDIRSPVATDINYPVGKRWINTVASLEFTLVSVTSAGGVVAAVWSSIGTLAGPLNTLTGDSGGTITPVAGNLNIFGTGGQIITAGSAGAITLSLPAAIVTPGSLTTTTTLTVGTNLTVNGNLSVAGTISFTDGLVVTGGLTTDTLTTTGNVSMTGAASVITIGDAARTATMNLGTSTAANSLLIQNGINSGTQTTSINNGATAAASIVNILSGAGSAGASQLLMADNPRVTVIDLGNVAPAAARTTTIAGGNAAVNDTVTLFGGAPSAGTQTFNLFSGNATGGTQVFNLGTGTGALALNIGTGATGVKTIAIGGTAANVITLGNTQTGGSIAIGALMTTGTITIGGTGLQVGTLTFGGGTGAQTVNLATGGTGIKTVNIGNTAGVANVLSIGTLLGTTTFNGPTLVTLASGAATGLAVDTSGGTGVGATINTSGATVDALQLLAGGLKVAPVVVAAGASPLVAAGRFVRVTFSGVSIASGATQTFVITNSVITGASTVCDVKWFGATAGSALSISAMTPSAGSLSIVMTNGTSATMVTSVANITFDVWVMN